MLIALASKPSAATRAAEGTGDQDSTRATALCSGTDCTKQAVTSFGSAALCFDHFCARCYELLERVDANTVAASQKQPALPDELGPLDECSRRVLEISLQQIELSNLQRARLLDILLWSGELASAIGRARRPRISARNERERPGFAPLACEKTAAN